MPLQQVPNDQIVTSGAASAPVAATILATQDTNFGNLGVHGASCGDLFVAKFTFKKRVQCKCGKPVSITLPDVYKFVYGCENTDYQFAANIATLSVTKVFDGASAGVAPTDPLTAAAIVWPSFTGQTYDVHFSHGAQDLNDGC
jgi:hypothetical protein